MTPNEHPVVDVHVHVGLVGDTWPESGHMSAEYRKSITYKVFLKYSGVEENVVCDAILRKLAIEKVAESSVDKVVLLALDHVFKPDGTPAPDRSHLWVANDFVRDLCRKELRARGLFGCSVHPYDPNFESRVKDCVDSGAVLIKWLPSAQQIDLADGRVLKAMEFLATAKPGGNPLPLLLHAGPEYAIPSSDERTRSYDFLTWSGWDKLLNFWRFKNKWHTPKIKEIHKNLEQALNSGAVIIFAHCGLPYFFSGLLGNLFEHSEFKVVRRYLKDTAAGKYKGKCYADVSAVATPFRKRYFKDLKELPADLLLYGSDFPTPAFEITAGGKETLKDMEEVLRGDVSRVVIPQGNLLDVNLRELRNVFGDHPLFTNFATQLLP